MMRALTAIPKQLTELMKHHELLAGLTYRQIYAQYRQSVLGTSWAIIRPVATVTIFTIVFSYIAKFPSDGFPYPLFLFCALLPWTLLNSGVSAGVPSLTNQANLVSKIYFPREILPIASIGASLVDFLISAVLFAGMMIYYDVPVSWNILYVVPLMMIELMLIMGVVFVLAMVNVWFRDVSHAITLLVQFWMYLTPIVYPYSMVPKGILWLYDLNPMVGVIEGMRSVILRGMAPDMQLLAVSAVMSVVIFLFGYSIFKSKEFQFADVI